MTEDEERHLALHCLRLGPYPREVTISRTGTIYVINSKRQAKRLLRTLGIDSLTKLTAFIEFLRFMKQTAVAYRQAGQTQSVGYYAVTSRYGVPVTTCLIARGRESWRVSNLALEVWHWKEIE